VSRHSNSKALSHPPRRTCRDRRPYWRQWRFSSANLQNWMERVRNRKTPNANIEAGYSHSVALCMTIAAIQTGRRVTFEDAKQEVVVT
jgi:hypothetical protein